ncbi:MAG: hypothetical protein A2X61_05140 [Ignavibacteria bacterium GWB2_35_12]|nr:MAG: hypothetical protein A2X63_02735 [Ignavibacteria bacterium GWA2_35_8]OGU42330.1 MAG: hypothetical protein A2X61_05140 [Ignavibacteria bacterium GWB2_35_12]OGU96966.1 MAG: hypothetical protein A2220_10025 [Ignavibacteria bacterium RIFOXYA2_FULL_35_10]OGV18558.1 MAG: hypothetical protein A2475_01830 [Ignavibacteria bacterium RIFOXYC2_FULL_35_21]
MVLNISNIKLYRITHKDNLDDILTKGMLCSPNHKHANPNFKQIGDISLIQTRSNRAIPIKPYGCFKDYVSFYFCNKSPMLYEIQNGFKVTMVKPQDIIYFVTTIRRTKEEGCNYIFTDGHAAAISSQFFNVDEDLKNIDWNVINGQYWFDTAEDPDRKRRKQAEFLVYLQVPLSTIIGIGVFNNNIKNDVEALLQSYNINKIIVKVKEDYYY